MLLLLLFFIIIIELIITTAATTTATEEPTRITLKFTCWRATANTYLIMHHFFIFIINYNGVLPLSNTVQY